MKTRLFGFIAAVAVASFFCVGTASAGGRTAFTYHVSITSLVGGAAGFNHPGEPGGEYFAPVFMMTQDGSIRLFTPGQPPSVPLAKVAEAGNPVPLVEAYTGDPSVGDIATTAPLASGHSASFTITGGHHFRYFSIAAMLFPTNDEFLGLSLARLPSPGHTRSYLVDAWDADSKPDDELCANMAPSPNAAVFPVPECAAVTGSGYTGLVPLNAAVHIASGIHGIGDLPADVYDWRNPVAIVTITNMAGEHRRGGD